MWLMIPPGPKKPPIACLPDWQGRQGFGAKVDKRKWTSEPQPSCSFFPRKKVTKEVSPESKPAILDDSVQRFMRFQHSTKKP